MNRQYVVVFLTLAFLVYMVGRSPSNVQLPPAQQLAAWGGLAIIFGVLVDIDQTSEVGSALVMLLLLSVLLTYGDGVISWTNAKFATTPPSTTTSHPTYSGKPVPL